MEEELNTYYEPEGDSLHSPEWLNSQESSSRMTGYDSEDDSLLSIPSTPSASEISYQIRKHEKNTDRISSCSPVPCLPPCRICSGKASGFHYGLNTCEACKVTRHLLLLLNVNMWSSELLCNTTLPCIITGIFSSRSWSSEQV